ncbi:MAG TPA: hypothetical protein VGC24_02890 [Burkholderiaceae bacterium]
MAVALPLLASAQPEVLAHLGGADHIHDLQVQKMADSDFTVEGSNTPLYQQRTHLHQQLDRPPLVDQVDAMDALVHEFEALASCLLDAYDDGPLASLAYVLNGMAQRCSEGMGILSVSVRQAVDAQNGGCNGL